MKLARALEMADEYVRWNAGKYSPRLTGAALVEWVDQRRMVYNALLTHGYVLLQAGIVSALKELAEESMCGRLTDQIKAALAMAEELEDV